MVTNIPIHARAACVSLYFVFDEGNKTRGIKNHQKNHNQTTRQVKSDKRDHRACILLNSTSISIAVFENSGVTLDY